MPLSYEEAREKFRPSSIKVLFIGESRPAGGKFFFSENSNLYSATKEAFEKASANNFDCEAFKQLGCWLYDVCDVPVNNMEPKDRKVRIREDAMALSEVLQRYNPKFIFVVKKGYFGNIVYPHVLKFGFIDGQTSCLLPFPLYQYREQYVRELTAMLKKTIFKKL